MKRSRASARGQRAELDRRSDALDRDVAKGRALGVPWDEVKRQLVKAVGHQGPQPSPDWRRGVRALKTMELAEANAPLSEYAREARKHALVLTQKGRPVLALVPLPPRTDLENLAVTTHPRFQAIIQRAEERYRTEGGLSTAQVRRRLVKRRAARRKR